MHVPSILPPLDRPLVVGSVSHRQALASLDACEVRQNCDVLEIRLDGLARGGTPPDPALWLALSDMPLLFTARGPEEGGIGAWNASERMAFYQVALPYAACIDIEAASIRDMRGLIDDMQMRGVPWIASYHDFHGMPAEKDLLSALQAAKDAGASVFKWAAMIHAPSDLVRLAEFQKKNHGIPVASMGMGSLAVVSRLLCAQYGSVLNYGYLGDEPTAPGQWDAGSLKRAIASLPQA